MKQHGKRGRQERALARWETQVETMDRLLKQDVHENILRMRRDIRATAVEQAAILKRKLGVTDDVG